MTQHRQGASFDYVLSLNGVEPGEFVGWVVTAQMYKDGWDANREMAPDVEAAWIDASTAVAVHVLAIDTSRWELGASYLDVRFIRPSDGFVRMLSEPIKWQITK